MEITIIYKDRYLVKFTRDVFLNKFEDYFKGDKGLMIEAFNEMEKDLKRELLKL